MRFSIVFILFSFLFNLSSLAEDGSRLWLRFSEKNGTEKKDLKIISKRTSSIVNVAVGELQDHWKGQNIELAIDKKLKPLKDGYRITSLGDKIKITSAEDRGLLYGAYHLLRLQETGENLSKLNIEEKPSFDIRILNHWDNLDGTVERGYAGYSLWKWDELPAVLSPRYEEYARANASIGINATVLNNVNASPSILTKEYLEKVKAIASVFRPYGIRVYLSVNFSSPKVIGGLENSDPLNADVQAWWKAKAKEIYELIPDFGGFLVKANSEGQPGPQDYGRTHADGANMLAKALKPYKGVVMWRAFVYNPSDEDRAKQAYLEFEHLDGKFDENVIVQIKNGPVDFQPREPFSPLFGRMKKTPMMAEFQITQEYLGFSNHLVYLAPLFKETLDTDTYAEGEGSTVAEITNGRLYNHSISAISGVSNIGEDTNWCGHHFAQSNWYTFGRLAWNHTLSSEGIAKEWIKMTFTDKPEFLNPVLDMMLTSRETCVNYMMPLGLHHIFAWDHHYGPEPWCEIEGAREDWLPKYYHKASANGIGFNRSASGSNAVSQYNIPLRDIYANIDTCPENLILWFHHVSWNHKMKNGHTLWNELCYKYDSGVQTVREYQKIWDRMELYVDQQRFEEVQSRLKIQSRDAVWWKDACLLYFQTFSKQPIPYDIERPVWELNDLKQIKLDLKHHN